MAWCFVHVISHICSKNAVRWGLSPNARYNFLNSLRRKLTSGTLTLNSNKKAPGITGSYFHEVPNTSKDVLLYVNNNHRFFRWLTIFGATQFMFWNSLAFYFQSNAKDVDTVEEMNQATADARPFIYKIRDALDFKNKYKHGITLLLTMLGCGFMLIPGLMALRNVHMVVLRKGGKTVDVVTFALLGSQRTIADVPLDHVSCQHSMHVKRSNLALKLKGRSMYFLVDTEGKFPNPKLFEQTVGLNRMVKKK